MVDEFYEIDHRVPLHLGGSNAFENLDLLCWRCHEEKTMRERIAKEAWLSIGYCKQCNKTILNILGVVFDPVTGGCIYDQEKKNQNEVVHW